MKPIRALPVATASTSASARGRSSRVLSRCASASIATRLAISPAAAPPTPSATAASRGLAYTASSLLPRTGPTSVRTAHARLRAVTAAEGTARPPRSRTARRYRLLRGAPRLAGSGSSAHGVGGARGGLALFPFRGRQHVHGELARCRL